MKQSLCWTKGYLIYLAINWNKRADLLLLQKLQLMLRQAKLQSLILKSGLKYLNFTKAASLFSLKLFQKLMVTLFFLRVVNIKIKTRTLRKLCVRLLVSWTCALFLNFYFNPTVIFSRILFQMKMSLTMRHCVSCMILLEIFKLQWIGCFIAKDL